MKLVLIGTGTVGRAAEAELGPRHELVKVGRKSGDLHADIADRASIEAMYGKLGKVDGVICCAGHVTFAPLSEMTEEKFRVGLMDKLMGQVNLVLAGIAHVTDGGSFTLTSGILDRDPIPKGVSASTVNAALAGFVLAAAIEMPRGLRINVVSPGLLDESAAAYPGFFPGHETVSSRRVGLAYAKSVEGRLTGQVIKVG